MNRLRQQHLRDTRRYHAYGRKVFYDALKVMITPIIERMGGEVNNLPLIQAYYKFYLYAGVDSAKKEFLRLRKQEPTKDLGLDLLVNSWADWMRAYVVRNLGKRIQDVTANTQKAIDKAIRDGLTLGETTEQIQKRIYDNTLGEIGKNRARLIAQTEGTNASNEGKRRSANQWAETIGDELYKKWLNTDRPTERASHQDEANKPPIKATEPFQVYNPNTGGINYMMHPGDLSASADQVCNCNCTVVYMSKRFAENNYNLYR